MHPRIEPVDQSPEAAPPSAEDLARASLFSISARSRTTPFPPKSSNSRQHCSSRQRSLTCHVPSPGFPGSMRSRDRSRTPSAPTTIAATWRRSLNCSRAAQKLLDPLPHRSGRYLPARGTWALTKLLVGSSYNALLMRLLTPDWRRYWKTSRWRERWRGS